MVDSPSVEAPIQPLLSLRGHAGIVNSFHIVLPNPPLTSDQPAAVEVGGDDEDFTEFAAPHQFLQAPKWSLRDIAVGLSSDSVGEVSVWDLSIRSLLFRFQLHDALRAVKSAQWMSRGGAGPQPVELRSLPTPAVAGVLKVVGLPLLPEDPSVGGGDLVILTQGRSGKFFVWRISPNVGDVLGGHAPHVASLTHAPTSDSTRAGLLLMGEGQLPQCAFCHVCVWWDEGSYVVAYPDDNTGLVFFSNVGPNGVSKSPLTADLSNGGAITCGQAMVLRHDLGSGNDGGPLLCGGYESGHVVVYSLAARHVLLSIRLFPQPVTSIGLEWQCNDLLMLVAGSADGALQGGGVTVSSAEGWHWQRLLWERKLGKGAGGVSTLGPLLVVGGWDGVLRLYDAATGSLRTVLPHHAPAAVSTVDFLPLPNGGRDAGPPAFAATMAPVIVESPSPSRWVVFSSASSDHSVAVWCMRL